MPGIIVLDGPDCTGKSTLQRFLVERYKATPMHLTWTPALNGRMFDYQTEALIAATHASETQLVVVDRHWISEAIYAAVFRGGSPWPHMGRMMDRVWRKHAAVYVLCLPDSVEEGIERHSFEKDPLHPYDDDKFKELLERYLALYNGGEVQGQDYAAWLSRNAPMCDRADTLQYRIGVEGRNLTTFGEQIMMVLGRWRKLQWPKALDPAFKNFGGHVCYSDVMLVGERFNIKQGTLVGAEWPFYEYGNSSLFLAEQLQEAGIQEEDCVYMNAVYHGSNEWGICDLAKRGCKVVAMGSVAQSWCRHVGIKELYELPHPQYAKRFPHKVDPSFVDQLKEVFSERD